MSADNKMKQTHLGLLELLLSSTINQLNYVMKARVMARLSHTHLCEVEDIELCHKHQKELLEIMKCQPKCNAKPRS